jgi:hypothetical protein
VYEILRNLINYCLHGKQMAEYEIREFAALVEFGEYDNDEVFMRINPEHAPAILELGMAIWSQIRFLDLYDADGELLYHYDPDAFMNTNEVILRYGTEDQYA